MTEKQPNGTNGEGAEDRERVETPPEAEEAVKEELEERAEAEPKGGRQLFGTFGGVFTPTLLTILGVIMYLREGWVVGNAGLAGAWLIISLSFGITTFTALSLSSVVTNIRIGAGGAFSVISQSLGLEVGGSIGVPLYLAQALAVAMYIFGFRAGWKWLFPEHSDLLVDLGIFALLFGIAYVSAGLAFKIQYVILAVIVGSLISVVATVFTAPLDQPIQWWGEFAGSPETGFEGASFWVVFAVFFPASTGIMAGANMSGDLKNPRKSIPLGTLSAIGLAFIVYLLLAWWLALAAPSDELLNNYEVMIDRAAWGPIVLAGLLGATFSSALSSLVGAPRILQALAEHEILPASGWFAVRTSKGEPRNAMMLTGGIVLAALMLRNLNAIAPLITMFFLITYAMINVVVFLEQILQLVSFRPLLRIPRIVAFLGAAGCVFVMFIINPVFGVVAVAVVLALHAYLVRKHLKAPFGDVRSGLFVAVAEWAAKKVEDLATSPERSWKANLLVPVERTAQAGDLFPLLRDLAYPKGFVRILGLTGPRPESDLTEDLPDLVEDFRDRGVFATWTVVDAATFSENLAAALEALGGAFFRSNMLFLRVPEDPERYGEVERVIRDAADRGIGVLLYSPAAEGHPGEPSTVHLVMDRPEDGWEFHMDLGNKDLAVLTAYKLKRNWKADLIVTGMVEGDDEREEALEYLRSLVELARIPNATLDTSTADDMAEVAHRARASITIGSLPPEPDLESLRRRVEEAGSPCLFALDSGRENALA